MVERAVGLVAMAMLEDLAMDADLDERGRWCRRRTCVASPTTRVSSKTTVQRHIVKLREDVFVLHEENRDETSGPLRPIAARD